ncbi:MAG: plasmid mobilization relaxosome protein MobC [Clostridia bacterium]|nr:plasmid mobilization relaxosome protein MobC [Clostridia bacterium]
MKNGEYSNDTDKKIIVNFRMTPEEKKKLLAKAEEAHMSLSGYIISLSQSKRVVLKDEIGKLTVEISRIGNNINQIARVGNSQKYVYKAQLKYISDQLTQVEELLKKILCAMFSDEEHTLISLEKKIDRLAEITDSLTERIDNIGGS